jgi:hypothetical protein
MPNKRDSRKVLLSLWVRKEFDAFLKKEARVLGVSKSELVKQALRKWYSEGSKEKGAADDET